MLIIAHIASRFLAPGWKGKSTASIAGILYTREAGQRKLKCSTNSTRRATSGASACNLQ